MTREEALEWFKERKKMNLDDKCQQAEDMAIKSLEQEPILDKITEIIEPLQHLSIDEMSSIEWEILKVFDGYKTLEQEPCEDAISREDFKNWIKELRMQLEPKNYQTLREYHINEGRE